MKRRIIIAGVLLGAAVPVVAGVFLFGCCVLPFHQEIHQAVPICHIVMPSNDEEEEPATPPQQRQEEQRFPSAVRAQRGFVDVLVVVVDSFEHSPAARRSYVALGGLRCEDDVGSLRRWIGVQRV